MRARVAFVFAKEEAARFGHNYIGTIGTEHILLGLLREGEHLADPFIAPMLITGHTGGPSVYEREGFAAVLLRRLNVEPQTVREAVEGIIGRSDQPTVGEFGLTPRAKRVIELAVEEARLLRYGDSGVGTEHLLLGLVEEGEGIAARVLRDFAVTGSKVRAQVLQFMPRLKARAAEPTSAKNNVITCRLDDASLAAIDDLLEAGIRTTRSDAAAWLIAAGIEAHQALFAQVSATIAEIRRLRAEAQAIAQQTAPSQATEAATDD
jgi:ATP-dependent Clp protease ATP-binding subunit ClpA